MRRTPSLTSQVSRRSAMRHASIAVLLAATLAGTTGSFAADEPTTIQVVGTVNPWATALIPMIPEFEQQSGIKVEFTQLTQDQANSTYNVKLNAKARDLDVLMFAPPQLKTQFARNGWLMDLTDALASDPAFGWDDFLGSAKDAVSHEGKVVAVPTVTEREVLFYRRDIFEQLGIPLPTTFDELQATAALIKEKVPDVAAFSAAGGVQPALAVTQYSGFLRGYGGDFITDGKASINTPAAVEALKMYGGLVGTYGAPGIDSLAQLTTFQQGKIAMLVTADVFWATLVDPKDSKIKAEDVGTAPLPAGPAGRRPYNIASQGLGINVATDSPNASLAFVKWATSADVVARLQAGGVFGARQSVWDNKDLVKNVAADYIAAIDASIKDGVGTDRPQVVEVARARDIIGSAIAVAIAGGDVQAAADSAQQKFQELLDRQR